MSERNSGESERSVPPIQPAQQVDPRGAAESGAASGAVNPTTRNPTPIPLPHTRNPTPIPLPHTQNPALSARTTEPRRFHSLQAATDQVTSLEQLAANQQDVITTLSDLTASLLKNVRTFLVLSHQKFQSKPPPKFGN